MLAGITVIAAVLLFGTYSHASAAGDPTLVSSMDTANAATGVSIAGHYAYVTEQVGTTGLQIFDITDPAAPVLVSTFNTGQLARSVAVSGSYAYVAEYNRIQVINVSNPASPVVVGTAQVLWSTNVYQIKVVGSYAYVIGRYGSTNNTTVSIYNISNPAAPTLVGSLHDSNRGPYEGNFGMDISGEYAYVAHSSLGNPSTNLQIIDISNPATPSLAGTFATVNVPLDVAVSGSYAYIAEKNTTDGLEIVDVSNPAAPVAVGSFDTANPASAVRVVGNYAYIAEQGTTDAFEVVDISTPSAPVRVGSFSLANGVAFPSDGLVISGDAAYLAEYGTSSSFQILNLGL